MLSTVGVCAATFAVAAATVLGASSQWSLLAVLSTDCVLNLIKCAPPLIRYGAAAAEAGHRRAVAVLEERRAADEDELGQLEREIEARESANASRLTSLETIVFATELIDLVLTSGHFLHLWSIHGTYFGIVDGVIALHFHSSVTAIGRKVGSDFCKPLSPAFPSLLISTTKSDFREAKRSPRRARARQELRGRHRTRGAQGLRGRRRLLHMPRRAGVRQGQEAAMRPPLPLRLPARGVRAREFDPSGQVPALQVVVGPFVRRRSVPGE